MSAKEDTHYYIVTSKIMFFGKSVTQKNIDLEKCHPSDPDIPVDGKNLAVVIKEMTDEGFTIESHSSANISNWVLDRVIFKRTN